MIFNLFKKRSIPGSCKDKTAFLLDAQKRLWEKSSGGAALDNLTPEEQVFFITTELEEEVNNGGFSQYLSNSSGNHANRASVCFQAIGAEITANICKSVISAFEQRLPENQEDRLAYLNTALTQETDAILETYDDQFYEYEDDLAELNYRYLMSHKDAFL